MSVSGHSSSGIFSPRKYVRDDMFSAEGLCGAVIAIVVSALIVGMAGGYVARHIYLVYAFPVLVGGMVGAVQVLVILKCKIRCSVSCAVGNLVAALCCVVAMHAVEYAEFPGGLVEDPARIGSLRHHWLYWGYEVLIIAGCSWLMTRSRIDQPFCSFCKTWMREKEIVALSCGQESVADVVESGRLSGLQTLEKKASCRAGISAFACGCDAQNEVVIQVSERFNGVGARGTRDKIRFVYPVAVVDHLHEVFFPGDLD